MPDEQIAGMRQAPFWPGMEAIAPTLAYDHTGVLGPDRAVPAARAAGIPTPTLLMYGGAGAPFMRDTAETLSQAMPRAQLRDPRRARPTTWTRPSSPRSWPSSSRRDELRTRAA